MMTFQRKKIKLEETIQKLVYNLGIMNRVIRRRQQCKAIWTSTIVQWAASNAESNVASTHAAAIYASRFSANVRIISFWRNTSDSAIGKHVNFNVIARKHAGNDVRHGTND